jgi:pimeloyl-ACP methyl ester carboxylesterase
MQTLFILTAAWLGVNLLHAAWVEIRRFFWEKGITRDAEGLLPSAAAYTAGSGPVALLFIHGFADTPMIWKRMAERLAATGNFTCRAMRLPGSAEPAPQARLQSLGRWRQAIDEEIDALRAAHVNVWVIGHSMGAALALDAALRSPDRVAGVAVLAPMIEVSRRRSPLLPPGVWFRLARVALSLSPTFESCFSADGVAVDDPAFTYTRDRFIPFSVYCGLFQLIRSNRGQAALLSQPVFAATAERDSVIDTPSALRWIAACPGPKDVRALTDIGHVIPLETGWQALADGIAAFIRTNALSETHVRMKCLSAAG